jgi:1-acyl-sn-glycerol-3-phosphate acyltransferase
LQLFTPMFHAQWDAQPHSGLVRAVKPLIRVLTQFHPVKIEGAFNLPSHGAALLVGNHGLLGYESPLFFERLLAACGRLPIGLADRWFFKVPVLRDLLVRLGGTYGSADHGLRALRKGELVVCYPGGVREVLKREKDKYRCLWHRSIGFVKLAIDAQVPIVPFAAAGVDDTYRVLTRLKGTGEYLMGHERYDLPLFWGSVGPFPRRVPLWFRLGEPITAPAGARSDDHKLVCRLHQELWTRTQSMVDDLVDEWRQAA